MSLGPMPSTRRARWQFYRRRRLYRWHRFLRRQRWPGAHPETGHHATGRLFAWPPVPLTGVHVYPKHFHECTEMTRLLPPSIWTKARKGRWGHRGPDDGEFSLKHPRSHIWYDQETYYCRRGRRWPRLHNCTFIGYRLPLGAAPVNALHRGQFYKSGAETYWWTNYGQFE